LAKTSRTIEDNARLEEIKIAMLNLPTERDPANEAAMAIVREAAALLKSRVARN